MKNRLNDSSIRWIEITTGILNRYVEHYADYAALEGLPCAGKTTVINGLRSLSTHYIVDELRLPPKEESCISYLQQESSRTNNINNFKSMQRSIIGDRCIVSTLAHKATLLTFQEPTNYTMELETLEHLSSNKQVILPARIISLDISINTSRARQRFRDRDILEGRLWYDPIFLSIIDEATVQILNRLYGNRSKITHVNSESNSEKITINQIREILEGKK